MKEQISKIKETSVEEIKKAEDLKTLNEIRVKYLGKKGELTAVLRGMGGLSPEERPIIGSLVNEVRDELEKLIPAGPWKMIWDSYPDYLKKAFYNVFSSRGENNREDTRLRVDDWIEVIGKYVDDLNGKLRKTNSNELFLGLKKVDKAIARMKTTPVKISAKDNYNLDRYNKR